MDERLRRSYLAAPSAIIFIGSRQWDSNFRCAVIDERQLSYKGGLRIQFNPRLTSSQVHEYLLDPINTKDKKLRFAPFF